MPAQCVADKPRHDDRSPAARGLRVKQVKGSVDSLQLFLDAEIPEFEINVLPAQSESLPLPKPHGESDRIEGFQSVTVERLEESPRFIGGEGLYFESLDSRSIN